MQNIFYIQSSWTQFDKLWQIYDKLTIPLNRTFNIFKHMSSWLLLQSLTYCISIQLWRTIDTGLDDNAYTDDMSRHCKTLQVQPHFLRLASLDLWWKVTSSSWPFHFFKESHLTCRISTAPSSISPQLGLTDRSPEDFTWAIITWFIMLYVVQIIRQFFFVNAILVSCGWLTYWYHVRWLFTNCIHV